MSSFYAQSPSLSPQATKQMTNNPSRYVKKQSRKGSKSRQQVLNSKSIKESAAVILEQVREATDTTTNTVAPALPQEKGQIHAKLKQNLKSGNTRNRKNLQILTSQQARPTTVQNSATKKGWVGKQLLASRNQRKSRNGSQSPMNKAIARASSMLMESGGQTTDVSVRGPFLVNAASELNSRKFSVKNGNSPAALRDSIISALKKNSIGTSEGNLGKTNSGKMFPKTFHYTKDQIKKEVDKYNKAIKEQTVNVAVPPPNRKRFMRNEKSKTATHNRATTQIMASQGDFSKFLQGEITQVDKSGIKPSVHKYNLKLQRAETELQDQKKIKVLKKDNSKRRSSITGQLPASQIDRVDQLREKGTKKLEQFDNQIKNLQVKLATKAHEKAIKRQKRAQTALAQRKPGTSKEYGSISNKISLAELNFNDSTQNQEKPSQNMGKSSLTELDAVIAQNAQSYYDSEPVLIDEPDGHSSQLNFNSSVEWQMNKQKIRPIQQRGKLKSRQIIEEVKQERAKKFFDQFVALSQQIDENDMSNLLQALELVKKQKAVQESGESPKLINIDSQKKIIQHVVNGDQEMTKQSLNLETNLEYDIVEPPLTEMDKSPDVESAPNLIEVDETSPEIQDYKALNYKNQEGPLVDVDPLDTVHVQNDDSQRSWPYEKNVKSRTQSINQDYSMQQKEIQASNEITPQFEGNKIKIIQHENLEDGGAYVDLRVQDSQQQNVDSGAIPNSSYPDEVFDSPDVGEIHPPEGAQSGLTSHSRQAVLPDSQMLILLEEPQQQEDNLQSDEQQSENRDTGKFAHNTANGIDKMSQKQMSNDSFQKTQEKTVNLKNKLMAHAHMQVVTDAIDLQAQPLYQEEGTGSLNKSKNSQIDEHSRELLSFINHYQGKKYFFVDFKPTVSTIEQQLKFDSKDISSNQNEFTIQKGPKLAMRTLNRKYTSRFSGDTSPVVVLDQSCRVSSTASPKIPILKRRLSKKSHSSPFDSEETPKNQLLNKQREVNFEVFEEPLLTFDDLDMDNILKVKSRAKKPEDSVSISNESTGSLVSQDIMDANYWSLHTVDKHSINAAEFDMFAYGMLKSRKMINYLQALPKYQKRIFEREKALKAYENFQSYNDLVLKNKVMTICFLRIKYPAKVEELQIPLSVFDLKTVCGHQGIYHEISWDGIASNSKHFNGHVKKEQHEAQQLEEYLNDLLFDFAEIYEEFAQGSTQKYLNVPEIVIENLELSAYQHLRRMMPLSFRFKQSACIKEITDYFLENIVQNQYDPLLKGMNFDQKLARIEDRIENVELNCFAQNLGHHFNNTWAYASLGKKSVWQQINQCLYSFSIHEASKLLHNQPDDLYYNCQIEKLRKIFLAKRDAYIYSLLQYVFSFSFEEKQEILEAKTKKYRSKSIDVNDPTVNRKHHYQQFVVFHETLAENLQQYLSDDDVQPDREYRYLADYKRENALDINHKQRQKMNQRRAVEEKMIGLKDSCSVMYKDLRMIINQDDQDTNDLQKLFAYKTKFVRDFQNHDILFEVFVPCEQSKTQRKLDLTELCHLKFLEKDMSLNESQSRRSVFLETVAFLGKGINSFSGFPFKSNSPLLERLKAKKTKRNLIRNQSKQCWHVLSQMGGSARNYGQKIFKDHMEKQHTHFFEEMNHFHNCEHKWEKLVDPADKIQEDVFETDESMKDLDLADFLSDQEDEQNTDPNFKKQQQIDKAKSRTKEFDMDGEAIDQSKIAKNKKKTQVSKIEKTQSAFEYYNKLAKDKEAIEKTVPYYESIYIEPTDIGHQKSGNFYELLQSKVKVDRLVENIEDGALNDNVKQYDKLNIELNFLHKVREMALEKFETEEQYLASKQGNMMEIHLQKAEEKIQRQMNAMKSNFTYKFEDQSDIQLQRKITNKFLEYVNDVKSPKLKEQLFSEDSDILTDENVKNEQYSDMLPESKHEESHSHHCSHESDGLDKISLGSDKVTKKIKKKSFVVRSRRGTILQARK